MTPTTAAGAARARLVGCGIFSREFGLLPESLRAAFEPEFLDSMLHMAPIQLDIALESILDSGAERSTVFAFGDCCPHMEEIAGRPRAARTCGDNCCEIYLGTERYRRLRKERTFFLMPEWAARWEAIFKDALGLKSSRIAGEFVRQSLGKAVYIDTGTTPVPHGALAGFSAYTGLAVTVEAAGPGFFAAALRSALENVSRPGPTREDTRG